MNKILLTNVLKAHFQLTQAVVECLPETLKKPVKHFRHQCMTSIQDALESALRDANTDQAALTPGTQQTGLQSIKID